MILLAVAATLAASEPRIVGEARQFMDEYRTILVAGDRARLIALYDRGGTYILGDGTKEFRSPAGIAEMYKDWGGPAAFEWHDLSYEPVAKDAVMVLGRFTWTPKNGRPAATLSYSSLLVRREGKLRIRVEDESRP